jgi:hypothetical protein
MWINQIHNFDNIDVNSSITVKAESSPSAISNTKESSLIAATASDTENQKKQVRKQRRVEVINGNSIMEKK